MKYLLDGEETHRLLFRRILKDDVISWIEFFKDPTSFQHWKEDPQLPAVKCEHWYLRQQQRYQAEEGGMNVLIEKSTGQLVGHCGLLIQQVDGKHEMEIGYSLLSAHRNKGYAIEAAIKCRDFAFKKNFSDSLISIISVTNLNSAKVAIKNGMHAEKETRYHENDVTIFRISRTQWIRLVEGK